MSKSHGLLLPIICCFCLSLSHAQTYSSLEDSYTDFFEAPRETIHLHLNKTLFLKGEEIWFTAYIYDRKNSRPFLETKNLICGIYDVNGKQLIKERFYVKDGITSGHFKINPPLSTGTYYIKAATNWMQNFDEEDPFVQQIEILGDSEAVTLENNDKIHHLHILPEGGHLVSNVTNSIGFIALDNQGLGLEIKNAIIKDSHGNTHLTNIITSRGMGKFDLNVKPDLKYILTLELQNGKKIIGKLPKPKTKGIALAINNLDNDKIAIALRTNKETLKIVEGDPYYLAIHRDGLITANTFKFLKTTKTLHIGKKNLLPGINILTLFGPNLEPIAERLLYNNLNPKTAEITIKQDGLKKIKDSVHLNLDLYSKKNTKTALSITVLPEETLSNENNTSIFSSFLLKPYLRNSVAPPNAYFKNADRETHFKLDLFLLVQGWSKYDWATIFEAPPVLRNVFEKEIQIHGKVFNNAYGSKEQIGVFGDELQDFKFTDIARDRSFSITESIFYKNDSLVFSMINRKGQLQKPDLEVSFSPNLRADQLTNLLPKPFSFREGISKEQPKIEEPLIDFLAEEGIVKLNNVTVTEDKIEKVPVMNTALLNNIFYTSLKITEKETRNTPMLKDLMLRLGFRYAYVAFAPPSLSDSISTGPNPYAVGGSVGMQPIILPKSPRGGSTKPPIVYLDDIRVQDVHIGTLINNLPANLLDTPTNLVDEIYYEHTGLDKSNGGSLYIYLKYGGFVGQQKLKTLTKVLATEGFQKPIAYYNPKYSNHASQTYLDYGVVHWEGRASSNNNGQVQLKFPHFGLEKVRLFIEGMATDGTLYSEEKLIDLSE